MALKLWSKLENVGDVTSPQRGTGGAETDSPTYEAAKFGNGILGEAIDAGCTFPTVANSINLNKGTIEFWVKMGYAHSDASSHYFWDFVDTYGIRMWRNQYQTVSNFRIAIVHDGGEIDVMATGQQHAADDLIHWGITWDREGNDIGGGKTAAIYRDGVEKVSTTDTWNASALINANLFVGVRSDLSFYSSDSVIDNLKFYDVVKTDFSDRETEDAGAEVGVKTLIQATLISAVPLIVLPTLHEIAKFTGPRV